MDAVKEQYSGKRQRLPTQPEFDLFDPGPDPALDELTELAAVLSDADYAYLSSMELNRLWFKSCYGFKCSDQPRTSTACQWIVETGNSLLLQNAAEDPRFSPYGVVLEGAKSCLSYAGVPLITSDHQIVGTLTVLAREPNCFSEEHIALLEILGRQAVTRLELNGRIRAQEQALRARQRAERALAIERCFVAATLDSIPALVIVLDTAGRMVRLNYACAQLTGLTMAEAVGRLFVDEVLEAGDRNWASKKLHEAASGQLSGPHETAWRIAPGVPAPDPARSDSTGSGSAAQIRRVSWTLRPLKGPNEEIQYLIVSGQDVTDQRQAEMALLSSEARYREMVENSLGFVFTCSMEGRLTSLNAFTAETLGYRVQDLTGRLLSDVLDSSGAATFQECLRTLLTKDEWHGALPLRRSDGVYRRVDLRSRRMDVPGGRPFVLIHGIDETEQHEAEKALHLATHQREMILESVGEGIYGIDLEGRLTFINQAAAKILGYTPEQLAGRDVHEVIHHSHADGSTYSKADNPILQSMRRQETVRKIDEVFWRQDGTSIPVEYSASPLIENGRNLGMVIAFQDISERRRLEKMKDEFISSVGHELRTPLTSLRASLGLIAASALDKRPEKRAQMLEMAIGNCDRVVRLVNDILDFDSMKKGKLTLDRRPVEAAILLRRAADVAHNAASQVRITIRIDAPPVKVLADEERILQVLNELVANAIKFSSPETLICLSAQPNGPNSKASRPDARGEVCIIVEDQGRGIAPEKLEGIFDRFQQGDASDSRALGGTGLGLALCRSIVEQHGGRIWAESTPGQGSRFLFTLPAPQRMADAL